MDRHRFDIRCQVLILSASILYLTFYRNLAEKWATTYILPHSKRRLMGPQATEISTIEHLILLDLLGARSPSIRSYFIETAWLFDALASAEKRLGDGGFLVYEGNNDMAAGSWRSWFQPRTNKLHNTGHIGDDHVPFLQRGVSILHVIAEPFPSVWHSLKVSRFIRRSDDELISIG